MKHSLTALFAILCVASSAQFVDLPTGTIKGIIKTQEGQSAPFVNIYLRNTNRGTVSGADGTYILRGVKKGDYTLVASLVGHDAQEVPVTVEAGETVVVNIILSESAKQLQEILITETRALNDKETSIGKASIRLMDLPQSVVVLEREVLERQQTLRLSDVLMNTNGVYIMGTTGGTQEEIAGRGFAFGSSNTFKNGVRFNNAAMPEISALEKVEILKGSNAILFGNVAAGGVLNLVTKKPKFDNGGELSFRVGSYEFFKPSLDLYGRVNESKTVAFRINATYENAKSFRDVVKSDRIYFNPSFLIRAGKKTDVWIEADYLRDNRTQDFGTGAINYEIIKIDRNRFLGAPWSYNKAAQQSATVTLSHRITDQWELRALASYQGYNNDAYGTTRPNAGNFVKADGTWLRGLQRTGSDQQYYIAQVDAVGKINTGSFEHSLLVGADADHYNNSNRSYAYKNPLANPKVNAGNVYDSINVFDLFIYPQRRDIPDIARNTQTKNPIGRAGIYAQDLIAFTRYLKVLVGGRFSTLHSESNVLNYASGAQTITSYDDHAFTPRLGVVYQPIKNISVFTSYANSFALNTAIDTQGKPLAPSFIDQVEAGIKADLLANLVSANLTAYHIVNDNVAQPVLATSPDYNPNYPNAQELAGEVTSKGIELDLMTKPINGFSFIAGYSFNDTRYTKSKQYIEGSRLRYNPSHTANGSVYYTFSNSLKGLNVGLIGLYVGDRVAGRPTRTSVAGDSYKLMTIPDYFQLDASIGYSFSKIGIRIKVSNLLDELSYNVHDDNSVNPIAPRLVSGTLSYKL